jgi:hypothetical protein
MGADLLNRQARDSPGRLHILLLNRFAAAYHGGVEGIRILVFIGLAEYFF